MYRSVTWDFTSFTTALQSYQDDGRVITKVSMQWSALFTIEKNSTSSGYRPGTARSAVQRLAHRAAGAPKTEDSRYEQEEIIFENYNFVISSILSIPSLSPSLTRGCSLHTEILSKRPITRETTNKPKRYQSGSSTTILITFLLMCTGIYFGSLLSHPMKRHTI